MSRNVCQTLALATLATLLLACGGDSGELLIDADPNAPDADLSAPDADLNAPDADPNAPDADPNNRAPTITICCEGVCGDFFTPAQGSTFICQITFADLDLDQLVWSYSAVRQPINPPTPLGGSDAADFTVNWTWDIELGERGDFAYDFTVNDGSVSTDVRMNLVVM